MTHPDSSDRVSSAAPRSGAASLPPGLVLYQLAVGHYLSRALALAVELEIADRIGDSPRSVEYLAAETGTHAGALARVLRLLTSAGVLVEDPATTFGLTATGALLRADAPGSMKDAMAVFAGTSIQDSWRELEYCVRTGEPAFKRENPDGDAFDALRADPVVEARFDRAMAAFTRQTAAAVVSVYDFGAFERVVDVGGGNGAMLIGILSAFPNLRGTVFDQAAVAERARHEAQAAGLSDRLDAIGGDFFGEIPKGADAYLIKHVIHDWNDADAARILKRCREAMGDSAKLLIVEGIYPERIDSSLEARGATANDVNMLVCTGGRQRSEAEFRELLAKASFRLERIVPTLARVSVIEAAPC